MGVDLLFDDDLNDANLRIFQGLQESRSFLIGLIP